MNFKKYSTIKSLVVTAAAISFGVLTAKAANGTWSATPADTNWGDPANWVGGVVPGATNVTTGAQNTDTATFNAPIFNGIGGFGNPILPDGAAGTGITNRDIGSILFDTANCGSYAIGSSSEFFQLNLSATLFPGGNVTMNPTVVNPQTFFSVRFHYQNSSNGGYQFTNNATTPTATLYFGVITNEAANSRPLTFTVAGSNTGTNTIGHFDDRGGADGAVHLTKSGTGRWIFLNANDFPQKTSGGDNIPANISIVDGTLEVQNAGSLGAITMGNLVISNTGILQIDNAAMNNNGFTIANGGTIKATGNSSVNYVSLINAAAGRGNLVTVSSGDYLNVLLVTNGAADTVMHVSGPGTVNLFGAPASGAGYVGSWSIDSGTLQISNAATLGSSSSINIAAGASVDVSPVTVGSSFPMISLTASGTGTTVGSMAATLKADSTGTIALGSGQINLNYTPTSFSGDSSHPALYVSQGTLSLGGNTFIVSNAAATPLGVGTYSLVQQASGSITSGGNYAVIVTGAGLATSCVGSIQVSGGNLNLVVSFYTAQNLTWAGGNPNSVWDVGTTANWLDGGSPSVFNNSDLVLFNSVGSANPVVTLSGTIAPGSVTVDTSANNYTFTGSGTIVGNTGLTKMSPGTLALGTVNTYFGNTVISNGTLQVAANNAIPGASDTAIGNTATLDLNALNDVIGALDGNGTVNNTGSGASQLTIGNNNHSGTFSGLIENTSGTLALTKAGNGTETLATANTFSGGTSINAGTIKPTDPNALGTGGLNMTAGVLDLATNLNVAGLSGSGGTIENNSTTTTNMLVINGSGTNACTIADGSGGGGVKVLITAGSVRYLGANTYSGGTILAEGASLQFGSTGRPGSGGIVASNDATITICATNPSTSINANITTVDGAAVTLTSSNTANSFGGLFFGSATATNICWGNVSLSAQSMFGNFAGTVVFTNAGTRLQLGSSGVGGGTNATFDLESSINCRDANNNIYMGALLGSGTIGGANAAGTSTFIIGSKDVDSTFNGAIRNGFPGKTNNAVTKVGTARLTFGPGLTPYVYLDPNTLNFTTNFIYTNTMAYFGPTTVSNGVLQIVAPDNLTNSSRITVASSTATLDVASMGSLMYQFDGSGDITNGVLSTNSLLEVVSNQTLAGIGTIQGNVLLDQGSVFSVGLPVGSLTVHTNVELAGAVDMTVNNSATPNASELIANNITIDGTSTLTVTNAGPAFSGGEVFQLFNHPVTFPGVTLQNMSSPGILVSNKLAIDGSIVVIATVNTTPTNILFGVTNGPSGPVLSLSWPADHTGWRLQYQTNTLAAGLNPATNTWFDVPNSTTIDATNFLIDPNSPAVFYKMVYP